MKIDSKNSYSMFDFSKIFSFSVDMFANSDSGEGMNVQMVSMMKLKILMGRGAVRGCGKGCGLCYWIFFLGGGLLMDYQFVIEYLSA